MPAKMIYPLLVGVPVCCQTSSLGCKSSLLTSPVWNPLPASVLQHPANPSKQIAGTKNAEKEATWDLFVVWQRGKTAGPLRALLDCLQSKPKAPSRLEAPKAQSNFT